MVNDMKSAPNLDFEFDFALPKSKSKSDFDFVFGPPTSKSKSDFLVLTFVNANRNSFVSGL